MTKYYGYCKNCGSIVNTSSTTEIKEEWCERCTIGREKYFPTELERDIYVLECKHNTKLNIQKTAK